MVDIESLESVNRLHASCSIDGYVGRHATQWVQASGGGLCVYADPLYRAPRGTPPRAVEECRRVFMRHALSPMSICDTQFFLVEAEEAERRGGILRSAVLSCGIVVGGVVAGLTSSTLSSRLRSTCLGSALSLRRTIHQIDMI